MNQASRQASVPVPSKRSFFPMFTIVGTIGLGLVIVLSLMRNHRNPAIASAAATEGEMVQPAEETPARAATPSAAFLTPPKSIAAQRQPEASSAVSGPGSAMAEQLIGSLAQLQISGGKLTPEQGQQIQQTFQQLVAQGAAALPSIRAFLDQNQDWAFGKWTGGLTGPPSIRTGLIDTLRQIGGAEATSISQQMLQNTADPLELSLLARNLEQAEPGQHAEQAVQSANSVLDAVAKGVLTNLDVGPLFQILQNYGSTSSAAQLEKLAPQWGYYATMALADMPSGQGVPALTRMAVDSSPAGIANRDFALQMLAQDSALYPDANNALVDLARQRNVPDSAWRGIADVLGGLQYQFSRSYPDNVFAPVDGPGFRSYRQQNGNQNFVSTELGTGSSDVSQRLAVIEQLLAAAPGNPAAVDALNQARAKLSGAGTTR